MLWWGENRHGKCVLLLPHVPASVLVSKCTDAGTTKTCLKTWYSLFLSRLTVKLNSTSSGNGVVPLERIVKEYINPMTIWLFCIYRFPSTSLASLLYWKGDIPSLVKYSRWCCIDANKDSVKAFQRTCFCILDTEYWTLVSLACSAASYREISVHIWAAYTINCVDGVCMHFISMAAVSHRTPLLNLESVNPQNTVIAKLY